MMNMNYEGYDTYKSDLGVFCVRTRNENKIVEDGEKRKEEIKNNASNSKYESKHDEYEAGGTRLAVVAFIALICIIATIVKCTSSMGFWGFIIGIAIGIGIAILAFGVLSMMDSVGKHNWEKQMVSLEKEVDNEIRKVDEEVKKRIVEERESYDRNVKEVYQKVISNPSNIDPMVNYSIEMFKRMISHADSDSSRRFIECNFVYVVTANEIKYLYNSMYTNPRDDFNFEKQRYRNLHYDYECERLALALAQAVANKMKMSYPPNTLDITIRNVESKVTISFKAPNENFVVARDIF